MSLEIYSIQNDQISFAAEGFTSTLRNEILKQMSEVSDKVYIDTFDEILHKYDNLYQRAIKMKSINDNSSTYIDFDVDNNDKDLKCKVSHHVRTSKRTNTFAKGYSPSKISLNTFLLLNKLKTLRLEHMLSMNLTAKKLFRFFYEKEPLMTKQTDFRIEKTTRKQGD